MKTLALIAFARVLATVASSRPMDIRPANLEPSRGGPSRPPVWVAPDATTNLALGCRVTASAEPTLGVPR